MKKDTCYNCKEKSKYLKKVKHKGKIKMMCEECFTGWEIEREIKINK